LAKIKAEKAMVADLDDEVLKEDHAHPACRELVVEIIGSFYREIYELVEKYRLLPSTVCLFDIYFRHYLSTKLKALPKEYFQFGDHPNGLHPKMINLV
jgi:hypothetical protein